MKKVEVMQMKQVCGFSLIIALLCTLFIFPAQAEIAIDFSYQIMVRSFEGDGLPIPSISIDIINKGLEVQVTNDLAESDRFMLLFIANGNIIPYSASTNSFNTEFAEINHFVIGANEEKKVKINFFQKALEHAILEDTYLHVILIGSLDRFPKDNFDNIAVYNCVVSLPISTDVDQNEERYFLSSEKNISSEQKSQYINNFLISTNTGERSIVAQYSISDEIEIPFSIIGKNEDIFVCFFINNKLLPISGKNGFLLRMNEFTSYDSCFKLNLETGIYQIYGCYVPINRKADMFLTSEKVVIYIK